MIKTQFVFLAVSAMKNESLKRLVFSRPVDSEVSKISIRLVAHRGKRLLAAELSLPGNTVSQRNIPEVFAESELLSLISQYKQANLITTLGDAEYKVNKKGGEVILGADTLKRKLCGGAPAFESAIEALDKKKNYILSGSEPFLIKLGISSTDGRVHDKRQGKFRQINRFLEYIEDIYPRLPDGKLTVFDLCCGKSYLSFAVYYYLTEVKGREVYMLGADLKRDVILWCESTARELGYSGMHFEVADISTLQYDVAPDMVISLHACDIATDIVLDSAVRLGARVILSTPCCHRYINGKVVAPELSFVTKNAHIATKMYEALTDSLRVLKLASHGYSVLATELTDPENTPKNTLIRAVKNPRMSEGERAAAKAEYEKALEFLLADGASDYLKDIVRN
ncbi:MAG: SAM-dependent methyltransferase [Clostridia bacterium]|nr:SAM-dependent methyltransferase [Clostridia bacterium]